MATQQGKILLLAGAGALLFMSAGKKKRRKTNVEPDGSSEDEDLDESDDPLETEPEEEPEPEKEEDYYQAIISKYMDPSGRAQLGGLYQIKLGDNPLEICREALFGSREPVTSQAMRQAAMDLMVRIDCGPWNQAVYGVDLSELTTGHAQIDEYWTQKGVSFNPIYENNLERMIAGSAPSGANGHHFALIWIPMINLDKLDMEGIVSTEGMYHDDMPEGQGGNMIDPPPDIIALGFDNVAAKTAGCDLPEGDFRKSVVAS